MGNENYKQHNFFSYMYVCVNVVVHFVMALVTMIHHKKYTSLQTFQFLHLSVFHSHDFRIQWQKKIINIPKKKCSFVISLQKNNNSMIVVFCTCEKVNSYYSTIWTNWRSFILFGKFYLEACNVCKILMRRSHNFSIDVKVTKDVEDQVVGSLQIIFFTTFQNNQMNYANFPNHDDLSMIWKYYLNLIYLVFGKFFKFYHIVFLFVFTPNQNLWVFGWKF
jgi:hypothetical protein